MNVLRKKFKKDPAWTDGEPDAVDQDDASSIKNKSTHLQTDSDQSESDSDSDSDIDGYAGDIRSKEYRLDDKTLIYKQLANINGATASIKKPVIRTRLNPKYKLALVGLQNGNVGLFEVDGERNKYIQNVKIPNGKTPHSSFTPDGESIMFAACSYAGNFYKYNLPSKKVSRYTIKIGNEIREFHKFAINDKFMGCTNTKSSEVCVLSARTYEVVFTTKLNEHANAVCFNSKNDMFVLGNDGHVYIWDTRQTSKCKHRFTDDGCVHSTSFALSEPSDLLSIGSDSGIVNTYQLDSCLTEKFPQPLWTAGNIKNPVTLLEYNHTGELLLAGSNKSDNNFKLIHSTSGTVYKNFPEFGKSFGRLRDASFSPLSGYMALGCSTGKAHLLRLPFYKAY